MQTKNLTPYLFGPKVTSRHPPQPEMVLVVRASYRIAPGEPLERLEGLDQGFLSAEQFAAGDDERTGAPVYAGDFADYKPCAEVLLKATCHPPGGRPVTSCEVGVSCGGWSKRLRVHGVRIWKPGVFGERVGLAQPFVTMPLRYERAFGGEDYPANPVGKGRAGMEMPNVEYQSEPIRKRSQLSIPAGFGPLNSRWSPRKEKVGRAYGAEWERTRKPFFSSDFDWTHFLAAPADQWIEGYLRGDEELRFSNLHSESSLFKVRLPGTRIRAFAKRLDGELLEAEMKLDTLWADLEEGALALTWRGLVPIASDDMSDVAAVLIDEEALDEDPRPRAHYAEKLLAFEADPLGLQDLPPQAKELQEDLAKKDDPALAANPASALLQDKLGAAAGEEQRALADTVANLMQSAQDKHGADLKSAIGEAIEKLQRMAPPPAASPAPGALPRVDLSESLGLLKQLGEQAKALAARHGQELPGLDELDELLVDPRLKQLDPGYEPGATPTAERELPEGSLAGMDLRFWDLSERDLSGRDLRGADLEGANLSGARLAGACLVEARMQKSVLAGADLEGADLTKADLSYANAGGCKADRAIFDEVLLEMSSFRGARLRGASLRGARGRMCQFAESDWSEACARDAVFENCDFMSAGLDRADFAGAALPRSLFMEVSAEELRLDGAALDGTAFLRAQLERPSLRGARGAGSIWNEARLSEANFEGADLPDAHFPQVEADRARFLRANLPRARFYRAHLSGSDLRSANLLSADFCKSALERSLFEGANLYDAKLLGAQVAGCLFEGANLARVVRDPA